MFRGLFDGPGIWIVLVVVLLLFGATRLPALARSIGQSTKIFRNEMKSDATDPVDPAAAAPTTVAEPAAPAPTATAPAPKKSEKSPKSSAKKSPDNKAPGKPGKSAKP